MENKEARKVYQEQGIDVSTQAARVAHCMQAAFGGRRIVIFSGGAAKGEDAVYEDAMAIRVIDADHPRAPGVVCAVVCDGVSSSQDSDVAALAAAETARDVLVAQRPAGLGTLDSHDAAMDAALVGAA